jgi:hypothetical protein
MHLDNFILFVMYGKSPSEMRVSAISPEVQKATRSSRQKLHVGTQIAHEFT